MPRCHSPYDEDVIREAENELSECCRICDCNPCMCGKKEYASDKEYRERQAEDMRQREEDLENGGG